MLSKVFLLVSLFAVQVPVAKPELSELSQAKATIHLLTIRVAQLEADNESLKNRLTSIQLTNDRTVLENVFRKELKCKDTDKFDWTKLACEASDVKKDSK